MTKKEGYQSLTNNSWQHFKKDKLAMVSFVFVCFCMLVAILGFSITPDSTPDANDQILELSKKPPGFKVKMLLHRKNEPSHDVNFFYKMFYGEISNYRSIPISSYRFEGSDIIYKEYSDKDTSLSIENILNLADVVYPVDFNFNVETDFKKGEIKFSEIGKVGRITKTVSELQKQIVKSNIVTKTYLLGTDPAGRDLLSRLMIGTRISFSVGFIAVFISVLIGVFLGALAGYFRGVIDDLIMWFINVIWSVPTLLLVVAISLALGKGFWQMFIAVGLTMWVEVARVIRGQIMSMREKEFVEAGRALGFSKTRIIFKHILPNVIGPVIVISAANFAAAILIEAGLSFLGIGAQPPTPSWGYMINAHRGYILGDSPYLAFVPGIAIMLIVLAFVLIGNGLKDALDTKFVDDDNPIV
jgi:peptide/nickel transport system permease protein